MRLAGATIAAFLVLSAPALAAQRWVSPTGTGDCSSQADACSIETGVSGAASGDTVIVTPGTYATSSTLTTTKDNVTVEGLAGASRPTITSTAAVALSPSGASDTVTDLSVSDSSDQGVVVAIGSGMTAENVLADQTNDGTAFQADGDDGLVRDSVAETSGSSGGVGVDAEAGTITVINVTAYSTAPGSYGLEAVTVGEPFSGCIGFPGGEITGENVIAHGAGDDLALTVSGCDGGVEGEIDLDHSNYHTILQNAGTLGEGGDNQTSAAQTNPSAIFVSSSGSTPNLHELPTAPTINHGIDTDLGPTDPDGNARIIGSAPDIGAYQFVPPPTIIVTTPASGVTYSKGQVIDASYHCTVAKGAVLSSCAGAVANGAPISTGSAGPHTFTVNAQAKNSATATTKVTYTVAKPPTTKITSHKISRKHSKATFKFKAAGAAGFQCALIKRSKHGHAPKPHFKRCTSAKTYKHLKPGKYTFEVRARGAAGTGPVAKRHFTI